MTRSDVRRGAVFLALVFAVAFAGVWAGQEVRRWRAPAGGGPGGEIAPGLVAGAPFPAVGVVEPDGTPRDTAALTAEGALVLFLRADCSACGLTVDRWLREIASGALAGVPVLGITTDSPAAVAGYRREKAIPFPIYRDPEHVFVERHGVTAVPFVVAVAPGGRIRDRFLGHRDDVDLERLGRLTAE